MTWSVLRGLSYSKMCRDYRLRRFCFKIQKMWNNCCLTDISHKRKVLLKSDGKLLLQCVQLINAAVVQDQDQSHLLFLQLINNTVYPVKQWPRDSGYGLKAKQDRLTIHFFRLLWFNRYIFGMNLPFTTFWKDSTKC